MKLHNTTDIPDETIREVVNFVKPAGVTNQGIYVENRSSRFGSGRASSRGYVTVRIQPDAQYPRRWTPQHERGYIFDDWIRSQDELLVMLLAHELRHRWQAGVGQSFEQMLRRTRGQRYIGYNATRVAYDPAGGRVSRGHTTWEHAKIETVRKVRRVGHGRRRGQHGGSERDADRYAMKMLRAWRTAHPTAPELSAASIDGVEIPQ